jgi:dolichyl-phosphate-mannose--protein O-mannosyl transferase
VFDETYFIPQVESYVAQKYFYDIHPPTGKLLMLLGLHLFNPDAANLVDPENVGNKVSDFSSELNWEGVRLAPKVAGALVPVLVFLVSLECMRWHRRKGVKGIEDTGTYAYLISFVIGIGAVFGNALIIDSRYALLTQILLAGMLLPVWLSLKYLHASRRRWSETNFVLAAIAMGFAVSIKWLALGVLPGIIAIVFYKEVWMARGKGRWDMKLASFIQKISFMGLMVLLVYVGSFAIHFSLLNNYAESAAETSSDYQAELKGEGPTLSLWRKINEWHIINDRYQAGVPKLDYAKPDEIGSMWVTWPIMARPISYYWETPGDNTYGFAYMIGNPVIWAGGLMGIIMLSGLGIARLFGRNRFGYQHFILILLYFANWLPFALISRVMYLYHYIPALVISWIIFGVVLHDFVFPRIDELYALFAKKTSGALSKLFKHTDIKKSAILVLLIILIFLGFLWFSPFTYVQNLTKEQFDQRSVLKEWNMQWPGDSQ